MIKESGNAELEACLTVANLMVAAARTAPKSRGLDSIHTLIVTGEEKDKLAEYMDKYGTEHEIHFFNRDANNIRNSPVVVLIGVSTEPIYIKDCNFCGFNGCEECKKNGGNCAFKTTDLGIAVGSAAAIAGMHHCDNRIMYSVSKAAIDLGYFPGNVRVAFGIPLSVTGKNQFFDRKPSK